MRPVREPDADVLARRILHDNAAQLYGIC